MSCASVPTTCYLVNRLPSPVLHDKSPLETLFNMSPDYNQLRAFGCECYLYLRPDNAHKLAPRSFTSACIFLLIVFTFLATHHVIFNEGSFRFATTDNHSPPLVQQLALCIHAPPPLVSQLPILPFPIGFPSTSSHPPYHLSMLLKIPKQSKQPTYKNETTNRHPFSNNHECH